MTHTDAKLMMPLLKVVGVSDKTCSPCCKKFSSKDELMSECIKYFPNTFSHHDNCGEQEPDSDESGFDGDKRNDTEEVVLRLKTALK